VLIKYGTGLIIALEISILMRNCTRLC